MTGAHRRADSLAEESIKKDNLMRQLEWRLEDERTHRGTEDDIAQRKLEQILAEAAEAKCHLDEQAAEFRRNMHKAEAEASAEKSLRQSVEQTLADVKSRYKEKLGELGIQLAALRDQERTNSVDIMSLRDQLEEAQRKNELLERTVDRYKIDLSSSCTEVERCRGNSLNYKEKVYELELQLAAMAQDNAEKFAAIIEKHSSELSERESIVMLEKSRLKRLVNDCTKLYASLQPPATDIPVTDDTGADDDAIDKASITKVLSSLPSYLELSQALAKEKEGHAATKASLGRLEKALVDESAETSAMRLRLQVGATLPNQFQSQGKAFSNTNTSAAEDNQYPYSRGEMGTAQVDTRGVGALAQIAPPASLSLSLSHSSTSSALFSDDQGPASLPASPMPSFSLDKFRYGAGAEVKVDGAGENAGRERDSIHAWIRSPPPPESDSKFNGLLHPVTMYESGGFMGDDFYMKAPIPTLSPLSLEGGGSPINRSKYGVGTGMGAVSSAPQSWQTVQETQRSSTSGVAFYDIMQISSTPPERRFGGSKTMEELHEGECFPLDDSWITRRERSYSDDEFRKIKSFEKQVSSRSASVSLYFDNLSKERNVLRSENIHLKAVIKDMRTHLEALQHQLLNGGLNSPSPLSVSHVGGKDDPAVIPPLKNTENGSKISLLETRLQVPQYIVRKQIAQC